MNRARNNPRISAFGYCVMRRDCATVASVSADIVALRNHLATDRLGNGYGRQRYGSDPLDLLAGLVHRWVRRLFVGFGQRGQEKFGDGFDVDAGIDLS